ncbi:MAG: hypothetical protein ACQESV_01675 [Thermodesulfobacteriota bacterium]
MSETNCCQKPEHLKDRPQTCTPEQIRICHGPNGDHPCTCEQGETSEDS